MFFLQDRLSGRESGELRYGQRNEVDGLEIAELKSFRQVAGLAGEERAEGYGRVAEQKRGAEG